MAQKVKLPTHSSSTFPPEAYEFSDEVTPEKVEKVREEIDIDFNNDDWSIIDGLGQIVPA